MGSIEELQKDATTCKTIKVNVLTTLAALAVSAVKIGYDSVKANSDRQKLQLEIQEIDRDIANYKSKFLGSLMYGDEISQLEQKRAEKMQQLKQC